MKKLYELETDEVSLVPRGANKKKFLVFKSLGGNNDMSTTTTQKRTASVKKDAGDMVPRKDSAVYKDPNQPMQHEAGAAYNAPLSDRAQAALKAMARIAAPHKDELKGEHVEMAMKEAGLMHGAGEGADAGNKDEIHMNLAMPMDVSEEHHAAALEKAKKKAMKTYKKKLMKLGYRKYPDEQEAVKAKMPMEEDDEDDGVEKSGVAKNDKGEENVKQTKIHKNVELSGFNTDQKRQLTDVFKAYDDRVKDLVRKNDELETTLRTRDESEKEREFVAKADSFKHLGIPKEEIVETLRDASKIGAKSYDRIVKQYETLNVQAKSGGLFKELGRAGSGPTDVEHRLEALVDSVVQKSDGTRTRAEIYADVLESPEGQKIYSEFKNGRTGGA